MIVVTGATGNVGRELTAALAARGEGVRAVARDTGRASFPAGVEPVRADLEMPESLGAAFHGARVVFLLGGWGDMPGPMRRIEHAGVALSLSGPEPMTPAERWASAHAEAFR